MSDVAQPVGKANYGIDAPGIVLRLLAIAIGALVVGVGVRLILGPTSLGLSLLLLAAEITAGWCLASAGAMVFGSKVIKLRLREKLVDGLGLRGDERVLDVGCGRGLLLNAVARKPAA